MLVYKHSFIKANISIISNSSPWISPSPALITTVSLFITITIVPFFTFIFITAPFIIIELGWTCTFQMFPSSLDRILARTWFPVYTSEFSGSRYRDFPLVWLDLTYSTCESPFSSSSVFFFFSFCFSSLYISFSFFVLILYQLLSWLWSSFVYPC